MNTTKTAAVEKLGPLTRDEEASFAAWTLEERCLGQYGRIYHGVHIGKVGLGHVWYVYAASGGRYQAQFRTARAAAAWIDSDMRLDWVAMWHRTMATTTEASANA